MDHEARTPFSTPLYFWDVPAALLGVAVAGALSASTSIAGFRVFWFGLPALMVVLRRSLLPQLTPPPGATRRSLSTLRALGAYLCLILGGLVLILAGLFFYAAATDPKHPGFAWPVLIVMSFAGALAAYGLRQLTP